MLGSFMLNLNKAIFIDSLKTVLGDLEYKAARLHRLLLVDQVSLHMLIKYCYYWPVIIYPQGVQGQYGETKTILV